MGFDLPITPLSSSDPGDRIAQLTQSLASVAEANAHAAEAMVELELARERLERQNHELERAKLAAEESARCKSTFLATMSHELRTPLNAIIGYSEILREDAAALDLAQMTSDLDRVLGAARHLLGLINDILDFSKIDAGRMAVHLEPVRVSPLVCEVAATVRPLFSRNRNEFAANCSDPEMLVRADHLRLNQCLLNLLSNASKFTSRGHVSLDVFAERGVVRFEIRDTGVGMDAELMSRLFEPFVQGDGSEVRTQSGTGLGLAISRALARLMGGDLTARSTVGAGSAFTLTLPEWTGSE